MNYEIVTTEDFDREVKKLSKKYHSFIDDLEVFKKDLLKNPKMGYELSENIRKVRMAIASKTKGKRGGARVITCTVLVNVINTDIYLLTIYDKGEQDSISKKEIEHLKRTYGLV
jgi:mRNA-degrading endonuclease RelE of RelBE toxin-antitoxin system